MNQTAPTFQANGQPRPGASGPEGRERKGALLRYVLALAPVLVAFFVQLAIWPLIKPLAWFLFFPAVFVSAWLGGFRPGIVATVTAVMLVWYYFLPTERSFNGLDLSGALSIVVFAVMGLTFSFFNDRLNKAKELTARILASTTSANTMLEDHVRARTLQLWDKQTQLAAVIDSAMDAIISVNGEMRVVLFNEAAEKMFRCREDQAMGQPLDRFIPERFRGAHAGHMQRFRGAGETNRRMGRLGVVMGVTLDGEEFPIEASISHIELDSEPIYTAIVRDISSRTRNLEALERQARLLHLSHDAIFVWSTRGGIEFWNEGAKRLYGYEHAESMGRPPPVHLKTSHPMPWAQIEDELRQHGQWEGTLHQQAKDGREVVVSTRLQVIDSDEEKGLLIMESNRDMTERQRLEEELLRAGEEERQHIGRELHDGLGQEITAISLLTNMLSTSLQRKSLTEEAATAEKLGELLRHAGSLVRRVSHGLQPVPPDPDSLMTALKTLADDASFANATRCVFECEGPVAVHNHEAANHLYRIAQEAVQNALRHGKPQEVVVKLARDDSCVKLEIEDDGSGFDPLTVESDGIGLSSMKYRAEAMNGHLELARAPEGGTLVRCAVPDPQPVMQNE